MSSPGRDSDRLIEALETLRLVRPDVTAKRDHVIGVTEVQDAHIAPVTIDDLDVSHERRRRTVIRAGEPNR